MLKNVVYLNLVFGWYKDMFMYVHVTNLKLVNCICSGAWSLTNTL